MDRPEDDREIQSDIKTLRETWDPLHDDITVIAGHAVTPNMATEVATASAPLLDAAKRLVSRITAKHFDPTALPQANAMLINISGRQRMLAQRVSKNACLIQEGNVDAIAEMTEAMQTYDSSLWALRNGMAEVGIQPPPTQEIAKGLDEVIDIWADLQPILTRIATGEQVSSETRATIFSNANSLTGKMNVLVGKYVEVTSTGL